MTSNLSTANRATSMQSLTSISASSNVSPNNPSVIRAISNTNIASIAAAPPATSSPSPSASYVTTMASPSSASSTAASSPHTSVNANPTTTSPPRQILLRVSLPERSLNKIIRVSIDESISEIRKIVLGKFASVIAPSLCGSSYNLNAMSGGSNGGLNNDSSTSGLTKDVGSASTHSLNGSGNIDLLYNYGLYEPPKSGKLGRFLDERRTLASYGIDQDCIIELREKCRVYPESFTIDNLLQTVLNENKRVVKKFTEEVSKGLIEKVKERGSKWMDPNYCTDDGDTPLSIAVMNDDKNMVTALIEMGAHLDYRVPEHQRTPIHIAALHNKINALATLLAYGVCPDLLDDMEVTALSLAASNGHTDAVRILLEYNANPDIADLNARTPLHHACLKSFEEIALLLIDAGANVNAQNNVGNTPLHVATSGSAKECLQWLLIRGADRNIVNRSNHTALQVATVANLTELIDLLKNFNDSDIVPPPPKPQQTPIPTYTEQLGSLRAINMLTKFMSLNPAAQQMHRQHVRKSILDNSTFSPNSIISMDSVIEDTLHTHTSAMSYSTMNNSQGKNQSLHEALNKLKKWAMEVQSHHDPALLDIIIELETQVQSSDSEKTLLESKIAELTLETERLQQSSERVSRENLIKQELVDELESQNRQLSSQMGSLRQIALSRSAENLDNYVSIGSINLLGSSNDLASVLPEGVDLSPLNDKTKTYLQAVFEKNSTLESQKKSLQQDIDRLRRLLDIKIRELTEKESR